MKKIIAVMLALMLCLGVSLAEEVEITGTWYLNEVLLGDEMSVVPAALNLSMTLTLNEDGSAVLEVNGIADDQATWAMEGANVVVTSMDEPQSFFVEGGCLAAQQGDMKIILGKDKIELGINTQATLEDYKGTWIATMLEMAGMQASAAGMAMEITVMDDKALFAEGGEAAEVGMKVEDSVLYLGNEGEEGILALRLLEDGQMILSEDMGDGLMLTVYFSKVK